MLFRDTFVRGGRGHADLPRLRQVGVNVVGLTVATRFPDLRGSLSRWHFRSLGMPAAARRSNMAAAEWLIGRIERWCAESGGGLRIIRGNADIDACLQPDGPIGVLIGVQGGHVLDGRPANIERLHGLGVRMLALAHTMDNALVGSGTGMRAGGLSELGREVIAGLEEQRMVVDLAHMSRAGIAESLAVARRPCVVSHTGLTDVAGSRSRWRRYSPATRNVPAALAAEVGRRGGLVGVALSTELLGGRTLASAAETFRVALDAAGGRGVAVGSDMDGALRMLIDVEGLPSLAEALLASGLSEESVRGVMGGNAVEFLRRALAA